MTSGKPEFRHWHLSHVSHKRNSTSHDHQHDLCSSPWNQQQHLTTLPQTSSGLCSSFLSNRSPPAQELTCSPRKTLYVHMIDSWSHQKLVHVILPPPSHFLSFQNKGKYTENNPKKTVQRHCEFLQTEDHVCRLKFLLTWRQKTTRTHFKDILIKAAWSQTDNSAVHTDFRWLSCREASRSERINLQS